VNAAAATVEAAAAVLRRHRARRWEQRIDGRRFAITLAASRLRIEAPRLVFEVERRPREAMRILAFSRGDWERTLARLAGTSFAPDAAGRGTTWTRRHGRADPLLARMLAERGLREVPLAAKRSLPRALAGRPRHLAPLRDGPVSGARSALSPREHTALVKQFALQAGASLVAIARLRPEFMTLDAPLEHDWAIGIVLAEDYADALAGPAAVERGAIGAYAQLAELSTALARHIRDTLGHPARAHHNGASEIQALPLLQAAGVGELGRHGSLINPALGASWRPAFVTTTLPLLADAPIAFGVQDYCMSCRLCERACPGEAIAPAGDYILTAGIRRWLVDTEKCYPWSRLRAEYCHLCVDVCPYVHKENRDPEKKRLYRQFVAARRG
jgi:NAD-dependent dihydropyrimidine dehydrogenase PreA subunit